MRLRFLHGFSFLKAADARTNISSSAPCIDLKAENSRVKVKMLPASSALTQLVARIPNTGFTPLRIHTARSEPSSNHAQELCSLVSPEGSYNTSRLAKMHHARSLRVGRDARFPAGAFCPDTTRTAGTGGTPLVLVPMLLLCVLLLLRQPSLPSPGLNEVALVAGRAESFPLAGPGKPAAPGLTSFARWIACSVALPNARKLRLVPMEPRVPSTAPGVTGEGLQGCKVAQHARTGQPMTTGFATAHS